jgi:riboflavin synthase alpha subunit
LQATESAQIAQDFKIRIESFQQQLQEVTNGNFVAFGGVDCTGVHACAIHVEFDSCNMQLSDYNFTSVTHEKQGAIIQFF